MAETRKSLTELLDRYFEALTKRDSAKLPLATNVKFTENGQTLPMKWALWATASGKPYQRYADFIDPERGQAATFSVVDENGTPVVMSLRIKAVNGKISEAEHVVCRQHDILFHPPGMAEPATQFTKIDPQRRATREEAIKIADLYFDGVEQDNGDMIPVTKDCIRMENGLQTVLAPDFGLSAQRRGGLNLGKLGIAGQINTGYFKYIDRIRDRRYPIYDEEQGIIFGIVFFEHPGNVKTVTVKGMPGVDKVDLAPFTQRPSSAEIAEAFQIEDGKIRTVAAILDFFPFGMKSGWDD
jgi:hypothetical protein